MRFKLTLITVGVFTLVLTACVPNAQSLCRPADVPPAKLEIGGQDYSRDITFVEVSSDYSGFPVLNFRFNSAGAKAFAMQTSANLDAPLDIAIDGEVISSPIVREPILGGSGQITGQFSVEELNALSLRLAPACTN